jgi:hypothetical protein
MKYFVFYSDDYYENGGVGFCEFDKKVDVLSFIEGRMKSVEHPDIKDYSVIEGRRLPIEVAEVVTRVKIC